MTAEHILLYAVAETHLRELEEPPIHADWRWEGKNRAGHGRKGGGVGFLWRREQKWQREDRDCADHLWMTGDLMGIPVPVCVVYFAVKGVHYEEYERLLDHCAPRWALRGKMEKLIYRQRECRCGALNAGGQWLLRSG
ncbi:hypothetical protein HPB52_001603 [Rhipicephalus sanguineus]|uniref:Uncharacterized protein n=1 Tax=Rhipicephalus sanguineus TaxID=34632 RepID=A0A9D4SRD7_RHISA|nr:hypothetical protein HPB52_001603 [Rhipicephalus sanguineus]